MKGVKFLDTHVNLGCMKDSVNVAPTQPAQRIRAEAVSRLIAVNIRQLSPPAVDLAESS